MAEHLNGAISMSALKAALKDGQIVLIHFRRYDRFERKLVATILRALRRRKLGVVTARGKDFIEVRKERPADGN